MACKVGAGLKTFTVTDTDAEKLAELLRENAEYRPDYFGSLASSVLEQLKQQAQPEYKEECTQ